jgi:hypothetical protein
MRPFDAMRVPAAAERATTYGSDMAAAEVADRVQELDGSRRL